MKSLKKFFYMLMFIAGMHSMGENNKNMKPKFIDNRTLLHVSVHVAITLVLILVTTFPPYIAAIVASFAGLSYEGLMYWAKGTPISLPDIFWNTVAAFVTAAIYSAF